MPRIESIHRSLLRNLLLAIALLSGSLLAATFFWAEEAVRTLSLSLTRETLDLVEARLERFFDPVTSLLATLRDWGEAGRFDDPDPEELGRLLVPLARRRPQVSAILVADARGREYILLHLHDRWSVRQTRRDEWGGNTRWREWTDMRPEPEDSERPLDYDPRTRPWFQGAAAKPGAAFWTAPYVFYTAQEPGLTAAVAIPRPDGVTRVVGLDVLLSDVSRFTTAMRVSENGAVCVLTEEDRRVVGLPRHAHFADAGARQDALLKLPEQLGVQELADCTRACDALPAGHDGPFRFASGGRAWWGGVRPFPLADGRALRIAVVVPESDLLGRLAAMRQWIVVLTFAVLGLAVWRAVALARRFSRPIEQLVRRSERISRGDLEPDLPVDSSIAEVRRLAEAQERMREGLRSLLKLERDLQLARQIQQDTFPERLPALRGYQVEAWSQPADETGGDSYDVIGLGAAPGGRFVLVEGERADRCVFLLADATGHGVGPALSVAQVRAMLRMALRTGESLPGIVRHMNAQLCMDLRGGRFVTAWLGELDATMGALRSFSAGQAPLLWYRAATREAQVLQADAPPLGILDDLPEGEISTLTLQPGDVFVVLSDGIYEAHARDGGLFGAERVSAILLARHGEPPAAILQAVRAEVDRFTDGLPREDDCTAVIVKRVE